jgi:hypothetical protein
MARGDAMAGLFKRTLVAAAGVVLGMAIVAGFGPLRRALTKSDDPPAPPHLPGERAPDDRA